MRNPLIKRIPKELKTDWRKYIVIIVFMVMMIGVISGMYVGRESMLEAIDSGKKELNLEDGSFELSKKATPELLEQIGEKYVDRIYEQFYRDEAETKEQDHAHETTVRVFRSDAKVNQASFLSGRAPENVDEIAIDRMHADNVGLSIGDEIKVGNHTFEIVGLLSYVNYLTLHESNNDLMFDAFGFDVAMVTPEAFESLDARMHYNYAYQYENEPSDKIEEADMAEDFLKHMVGVVYAAGNGIEDYLPEYLRQASNFAPSDIEGDSTMTGILCYILIGVIAFIFAITISNTIEKEASVIGTLRASGYSKREMIMHYMSMPIIVTLIGALIGNILGYTAFRNVAVNLYYNSYSLPTCHLVWSNTALIKTTVIPLVLMFVINLLVIVRKMQLSPLRFLRHDLNKVKRTKARRLPRWTFLRRFRLRNLFQNLPNYVILIFGVIFIELMMCFAFGLPDSLNNYSTKAPDMMFAPYQYMLMDYRDATGQTIDTKEATAEAFSATTLLYEKKQGGFRTGMGSGGDEAVTVYGIADDSAYIRTDVQLKKGEVCLSSAFADKFRLKDGDEITLHAEYENKSYHFKVVGRVNYDGGIAVFMPQDAYRNLFGQDANAFDGFFSRREITDINNQYIATVITKEDILKVTNQLNHSMGGLMNVFRYALIVMTAALIYLLTKIIIEKNEHSISMIKILGFENREIVSLYMIPTTIAVIVATLIGFAVGYVLMVWIFHIFMLQMDGYFVFYMKPESMILAVGYLLIGYVFVSVIDLGRIRKIPMDVALKTMD